VRAAASGDMGPAPEAAAQVAGQAAEPGPLLSEREIEVVRMLARGHNNRAIAGALFLAEATVTSYGSTASSAPRAGRARSAKPCASG
jgi:DNA-binding NarL/FixJ family response regulator